MQEPKADHSASSICNRPKCINNTKNTGIEFRGKSLCWDCWEHYARAAEKKGDSVGERMLKRWGFPSRVPHNLEI